MKKGLNFYIFNINELSVHFIRICFYSDDEEARIVRPLHLQRLDMALNPSKQEQRQKAKEREIHQYEKTFGQIDLEKWYHSYFDLLWYGQLPCTDVKGLTSEIKDELSFLKKCYWKGKELSCNSIFQKRPTDKGMCCSFNMATAEKIFKSSKYTKAISRRHARDSKSGFKTFEEEKLPEWYKSRNEPVPEQGVNRGLKLVIDAHSNRLSEATVGDDFRGFPIVVDDQNTFPSMKLNRELARPGFETDIRVSATYLEARSEIRRFPPNDRNCLFPDESFQNDSVDIKIHHNYTYLNCKFECEIDFAAKCLSQCLVGFNETCLCSNHEEIQSIDLKQTNTCIPWYYPSNDDESLGMCDPWNNMKFKDIMERRIPNNLCRHCLPDCTTTKYSTTVSYGKLRKCDRPTIGSTNILCNLVNDKSNPAPWISLAQNEYRREEKALPWFLKTSSHGFGGMTETGNVRFSNKRYRLLEDFSDQLFLTDVQKNPMYDAFEDDIGVVNIFFVDSTVKKFITSSKMSVFDYITEIGGSLGLFMGISIISVIEFIYWFLFNFCIRFRN